MVIGPEEATSREAATHHLLLLPVTPDHTANRPGNCQIMDDTVPYVWMFTFMCIKPAYFFKLYI